ncbi:hypothetical protein NEIG_01855 [Nematocida sp. ERTm5]|nr:hypothetical protein NEIG_01855 [Nematocida sp. ERTm5]
MEDGFVSDEELLYTEDIRKLIKPVRKEKRRACANCTCGKKEIEAEELKNTSNNAPVESNCGNCNLGDAFRCSSCPYTGLPPFKANSEVEFNPDEV